MSVCVCVTWNHTVQALDMILSHSALCAHFVNETGDESPHSVGDVAGLRVFESTLGVEAFRHAPCNAVYYTTLIISQTSKQQQPLISLKQLFKEALLPTHHNSMSVKHNLISHGVKCALSWWKSDRRLCLKTKRAVPDISGGK